MTSSVLFDIDGTLVDSRESLEATYASVCDEMGLAADLETFGKLLGKTLDQIFGTLHPEMNSEVLVAGFKEKSIVHGNLLRAFEGALRLVDFAVEEADFCGYLTSKDEKRARRALSYLGFPELRIFSPSPEMRPKPQADLFNRAREEYSFTRGIYVGDTMDDLESAKAASFDFVFAEWGYGTTSNGEPYGSTASSPQQAMSVIKSWLLGSTSGFRATTPSKA